MEFDKIDWIAVDWGTTNFRAWFIKNDKVIKKVIKPKGIKNVLKKNFENTLINNLKIPKKIPNRILIISCGMIGSKQGWYDTGYTNNLIAKKNNLIKVNTKNKKIFFYIVKGLLQKKHLIFLSF